MSIPIILNILGMMILPWYSNGYIPSIFPLILYTYHFPIRFPFYSHYIPMLFPLYSHFFSNFIPIIFPSFSHFIPIWFPCYSQNIPILPVFATHLAPEALSVGPEQLGVFLGLQAAVLGSGGLCQGGAPWPRNALRWTTAGIVWKPGQ